MKIIRMYKLLTIMIIITTIWLSAICNAEQIPQKKTGESRFLSRGNCHTLALQIDGTVWAWGENPWGQLGNEDIEIGFDPFDPNIYSVQVSGLNNVIAVSAGSQHSLALKADGTVWSWGSNSNGQLGDGSTATEYACEKTPVKVTGLNNVKAISAGTTHSLALKRDGTVWLWGLGHNKPVQVLELSNVVSISAGTEYSLALKADGTVWAWGDNSNGQLGDGSTTNRSKPVQVSKLHNVEAISAGAYHSLAIKKDGKVWAWGRNDTGQLGDGSTTNRSKPVQVSDLSNVVAISAGINNMYGLGNHSSALKADGTVWSWGDNTRIGWSGGEMPYTDYGVLGTGSEAEIIPPMQVEGLSDVMAIAAGWQKTIVAKTDGTLPRQSGVIVGIPTLGVDLNKTSTTIIKGDTETLIPTVYPADATNKNINWSTSNEAVVTVSNGVIKGISKGSATITVTTEVGGYTDTCNVEVIVPDKVPPKPPSISTTTTWTNADSVPVTITHGTDTGGSGVDRTEYSLTGATTQSWTTYSGTFNITNQGQTTIKARTIDNEGNISNITYSTVKLDNTSPSKPTLSFSNITSNRITLNWAAFSDAHSGYKKTRIYAKKYNGSDWVNRVDIDGDGSNEYYKDYVDSNKTSHTITGLDSGTHYRFYVRYYDNCDNRGNSGWEYVWTKPARPSNITGTKGGLKWSKSAGRGYVTLNWPEVKGATGYKVHVFDGNSYRAFDVGNVTNWDSRDAKIYPSESTLDSYSNDSISKDIFNHSKNGLDLRDNPNELYQKTARDRYDSSTHYWFRVTAYNSSGGSGIDWDEGYFPTLPDRTDNTAPSITFSPNGNSTYSSSHNTTVNITDSESRVDDLTLEYQWTQEDSMPQNDKWIALINGQNIQTPSTDSGSYYLNIRARDNANEINWDSFTKYDCGSSLFQKSYGYESILGQRWHTSAIDVESDWDKYPELEDLMLKSDEYNSGQIKLGNVISIEMGNDRSDMPVGRDYQEYGEYVEIENSSQHFIMRKIYAGAPFSSDDDGLWKIVKVFKTDNNRLHSTRGKWIKQSDVWSHLGNESVKKSNVFKIDNITPNGFFNPNSSDWTNNNITVSFNPSDNGGSGIYRWRYRKSSNNGSSYGSWSNYISGDTTRNINLTDGGRWKIQVQIYDNVGNVTTLTSGTYNIDKSASVCTKFKIENDSQIPYDATTSYEVDLQIEAKDNETNVTHMEISNYPDFRDSTGWMPYASAYEKWTLRKPDEYSGAENFTKHVYIRFRDKAGNISEPATDQIEFEVIPKINSTSMSPGIYLGEGTTLEAGVEDAVKAKYRIFYSNSPTKPSVSTTSDTPGIEWKDSGITGDFNNITPTQISQHISRDVFDNTDWTYVTFKVYVESRTKYGVHTYTQAHSLNALNDIIGYIGHNQKIRIHDSRRELVVSSPDSPVMQYDPETSDVENLSNNNTFEDLAPVKYRAEFDVKRPEQIASMNVYFDFNLYNKEGIEFVPEEVVLQRYIDNNNIESIATYTGESIKEEITDSRNRYYVSIDKSKIKDSIERYFVEYRGSLKIEPDHDGGTEEIFNEVEIELTTPDNNYGDPVNEEAPNRKRIIETKITRDRIQYE